LRRLALAAGAMWFVLVGPAGESGTTEDIDGASGAPARVSGEAHAGLGAWGPALALRESVQEAAPQEEHLSVDLEE